MIKHRGFPEYVPGSDLKVTIRRGVRPVTPIAARVRHRDRTPALRRADAFFLALLIETYGDRPFPRGNLDAGRINWLIGRELLAVGEPWAPDDYDAELRVDMDAVAASFPHVLTGDWDR